MVCFSRLARYGLDGLAPIAVDGVLVKTKKPIPLVCGPIPSEVTVAVCRALSDKGLKPKGCTSEHVMAANVATVPVTSLGANEANEEHANKPSSAVTVDPPAPQACA